MKWDEGKAKEAADVLELEGCAVFHAVIEANITPTEADSQLMDVWMKYYDALIACEYLQTKPTEKDIEGFKHYTDMQAVFRDVFSLNAPKGIAITTDGTQRAIDRHNADFPLSPSPDAISTTNEVVQCRSAKTAYHAFCVSAGSPDLKDKKVKDQFLFDEQARIDIFEGEVQAQGFSSVEEYLSWDRFYWLRGV